MFIVRQVNSDDHAAVSKLSRMLGTMHAVPDADAIARLINRSRDSFAGRVRDEGERQFLFVLEDTEAGTVVGMSMLRACAARRGHPLAYLQVRKREHYSEDLRTGQVHATIRLETDETAAAQVGDLILAPAYRGHRDHLGTLLGLVRLHFMGLERAWFADRVFAVLTPPRPVDQRLSLWSHLGRRFINLDESEAERFREQSREFISALFPAGEIYAALLPPETRNLIGRVGAEAAGALALLERCGFESRQRVDPFHGGPILDAGLDEIPVVRSTRTATLGDPAPAHPHRGIISIRGGGTFRAVTSAFAETANGIAMPGETAGLLGAQLGDTVGVSRLD